MVTPENTHSSSRLRNIAFVGRQQEMGELMGALEDALSGSGGLVMLVGEPGIGKTRTAQEFADIAERQGTRVLWGRCHEQQGMPPYWPWIQAIRSYVRDSEPEDLRAEMGQGASDIAEVVPEINEQMPQLKPSPPLDNPEQARFRLFDSITTFLKNASQNQPLIIVLDNLHWADRPSLLLMEFLGQEIGDSHLLVVGTYRDADLSRQHPLSETLGELTRQRLFRRVALRGLRIEDVRHFIQLASGIEPPRDLIELVYSHTEGNPLFVTEVVRMLEQEGEMTPARLGGQGDWNVRIPDGVREVIGRRLNRLSEECNRVLTVASVIGREFDFRLLNVLSDTTEEDLLQVLDEALESSVIEEVPGGHERYQFSHALVRQTLVEELSTSRRVRMHARIGEALEELYEYDVETHAVELAYHYDEAQTVVDAERLVKYSKMAGERALDIYAWEEALGHFQRALAAKEGQDIDAETAAILHGLGRAQSAVAISLDERQEGFDNLSRALDYYVDEKDAPQVMAVAGPSIIAGQIKGLTRFITRALTVVSPDSHDAGRLLSRFGVAAAQDTGDDAVAQDAFRKALVIAQRENDAALEAWTLSRASAVDWHNLRYEQGLERSLRAIELAGRVDEAYAERVARTFACQGLLGMGNLEGARVHAENLLTLSERLRDRTWMIIALMSNQLVFQVEGDWSTARKFSDRALALGGARWALGDRTLLEYQVGDFPQGETYLEQLLETKLGSLVPAVVIPLVARISGNQDRFDVAEESAKAVLSSYNVSPLRAMSARVGLALVAVQRGDAEVAGALYEAIVSQRGTMLAVCPLGTTLAGCMVCADRLLALLAHTMGKPDDAVAHFEAALAFCRTAGYRPELAWTCHDYAEALLQGSGSKDRGEVASLLEEASSISTELGMKPLQERVVELQQKAGTRRRSPAYPDGLTEREVEVLRLIASGRSNQEIADELFISQHTVVRHASNIFSKIGVTNRTEAASYATRHSLA